MMTFTVLLRCIILSPRRVLIFPYHDEKRRQWEISSHFYSLGRSLHRSEQMTIGTLTRE